MVGAARPPRRPGLSASASSSVFQPFFGLDDAHLFRAVRGTDAPSPRRAAHKPGQGAGLRRTGRDRGAPRGWRSAKRWWTSPRRGGEQLAAVSRLQGGGLLEACSSARASAFSAIDPLVAPHLALHPAMPRRAGRSVHRALRTRRHRQLRRCAAQRSRSWPGDLGGKCSSIARRIGATNFRHGGGSSAPGAGPCPEEAGFGCATSSETSVCRGHDAPYGLMPPRRSAGGGGQDAAVPRPPGTVRAERWLAHRRRGVLFLEARSCWIPSGGRFLLADGRCRADPPPGRGPSRSARCWGGTRGMLTREARRARWLLISRRRYREPSTADDWREVCWTSS